MYWVRGSSKPSRTYDWNGKIQVLLQVYKHGTSRIEWIILKYARDIYGSIGNGKGRDN